MLRKETPRTTSHGKRAANVIFTFVVFCVGIEETGEAAGLLSPWMVREIRHRCGRHQVYRSTAAGFSRQELHCGHEKCWPEFNGKLRVSSCLEQAEMGQSRHIPYAVQLLLSLRSIRKDECAMLAKRTLCTLPSFWFEQCSQKTLPCPSFCAFGQRGRNYRGTAISRHKRRDTGD